MLSFVLVTTVKMLRTEVKIAVKHVDRCVETTISKELFVVYIS